MGHPDLMFRIALQRFVKHNSAGVCLAIDTNWLNLEPNAASTAATKLRTALARMAKNPRITPLGAAPAEWMVETTGGTHHIRAARHEEAAARLLALGGHTSLDVIAIGQVILPQDGMRNYAGLAA